MHSFGNARSFYSRDCRKNLIHYYHGTRNSAYHFHIYCDMWDAYLNGIRNHISKAGVVFDRFHIMKQMNKAIEKVRWAEQKTNKDLKKTRFIWLKNPKNLTEKQAEKLSCLKKYDLKTARVYHIKLALARFWDIEDPKESEAYLKKWYFWATHSRLDPVIEAARGIKRY